MARNYYIDGNTVRKRPRVISREAREAREAARALEEEKRKEARIAAARENRQRAHAIQTRFIAFVSVSVAAIAATAVFMVQAQSAVTASMRRMASLESKLTDLRAENDAKYNEIITSVDLNYIKKVAMEELGMTYAAEDQIRYYTVDKTNFMDQYSDIPK